jgi:DNA-binding NarL/FixJ family response regulator
MRALITDDKPRARAGLRALLEASGCEIVGEATNGLEAITGIEREVPDIVILDVRMPGVDGIEATRIIKRRWPHVRVLALSLYPEERARALEAGADAFATKGDSIAELIDIVRSLERA